MIIETLQSDMETREKLMLSLYYLGMADREQLAKLLKITVHGVDRCMMRLNEKNKEDKHIISYSAPFNKGPKMYQLGPAGWKWVMGWIKEDRDYYQRSESQKRHYVGMTNILIRLMDQTEKEVEYYNTYEASEQFLYPWSVTNWEAWKDVKTRQEQSKDLPRPDIAIHVQDQVFWGEYDTSSEGPTKVKTKIRRYYRAFNQLGPQSSSRKLIVWITTSRSRARKMKEWATLVSREFEFRDMKNDPPEMVFVVEGEETEIFLADPSSGIKEEKNKNIGNI